MLSGYSNELAKDEVHIDAAYKIWSGHWVNPRNVESQSSPTSTDVKYIWPLTSDLTFTLLEVWYENIIS